MYLLRYFFPSCIVFVIFVVKSFCCRFIAKKSQLKFNFHPVYFYSVYDFPFRAKYINRTWSPVNDIDEKDTQLHAELPLQSYGKIIFYVEEILYVGFRRFVSVHFLSSTKGAV